MQLRFDDQVVLITGASTGIGAAVAHGFAGAGAHVIVHYNRSREAAEATLAGLPGPGGHRLAAADLAVPEAAATLHADVIDSHGRIDVLVNNAGALLGRRPLVDVDESYLQDTTAVNYDHVVRLCRETVPGMRERGRGSIVTVTSVAARTGGGGGSVVYAAAKAAVATFTRGLARELAPDSIRVNALSPGVIRTPFHDRATPADQFDAQVAGIPWGRAGEPGDCVGPTLFLASDEAAGFVTGQVLEVNGGQVSP